MQAEGSEGAASHGDMEGRVCEAVALGDGPAGGFKKDQGPGVPSKGGGGVRWKRKQGCPVRGLGIGLGKGR